MQVTNRNTGNEWDLSAGRDEVRNSETPRCGNWLGFTIPAEAQDLGFAREREADAN